LVEGETRSEASKARGMDKTEAFHPLAKGTVPHTSCTIPWLEQTVAYIIVKTYQQQQPLKNQLIVVRLTFW